MTRTTLIICCVSLFWACTKPASTNQIVLARVGSTELTLDEARKRIPEFSFQKDSTEAYNQYREQWIEKQLILQEAERLKLLGIPEVQHKIKQMRQQVIINSFQELVMNDSQNSNIVSAEEARVYYQENKNKFLLNERHIKFRHLIARSLEDAEAAKSDLMRAKTWEYVVNKYGLFPELKLRESDRFYSEVNALKEYRVLNRYLRQMGITEISLIEKYGNQYHFVQLIEEKAEGEHPELDWLIPQIQEWLTLEKKRRAYNSYLKNLYLAGQANNEIAIYDVLPKGTPNTTEIDTLNLN